MAKGKYEYWLTKEGLALLEGWARDGLTDDQIAGKIGIRRQTLYDWKARYPDISDTLKKGKEVVDREVENALFRRAIGFDFVEETRERRFNKRTGEYEMVVIKSVRKHTPPDTVAAIFWLKNRKPDVWREKNQDALTSNDDGVEVVFRGEKTSDC